MPPNARMCSFIRVHANSILHLTLQSRLHRTSSALIPVFLSARPHTASISCYSIPCVSIMDASDTRSPDVIALFDVDGTLTAPRLVRSLL